MTILASKHFKIDSFFKEAKPTCNQSVESESYQDFEDNLSKSFGSICPHCKSYLEGNFEYFIQHSDFCFKLS